MMRIIVPLFFVSLAIVVYFFNQEGYEPHLEKDIKVITTNEVVESTLHNLKSVLGSDYDGYRGHIYRVLSYVMHYLDGDETNLHLIAVALVYHDIGLWTDSKLAYLEPSSARALEAFRDKYTSQELEGIHNMIYWHHKFTPFIGQYEKEVNAVRKSDWIDATQGLISKGMPRAHIHKIQNSIPNNGFHQTLVEFGPRLQGWNIPLAIWEVSSILKW